MGMSYIPHRLTITHSTQKCNQAMTPNLNDKIGSRKRLMDMFAPTYAKFLESRKKGMTCNYGYYDESYLQNSRLLAREISDNPHLEWDRERWNEKKVCNMEKQRFEEVKFQKQMEFDEKHHAKNHEFEKE
ncbi:hypothetical protein O181_092002 [Austropuccinia psidii MF-1]|uniref:Uncharacterized protein n=1 Tax=Austropuccinia psidii MF-1 TaxID=1389203 RepID=A0A9Q3IYM4_9BASI|nr:hypothetical protein [Austropuccinia psidii MF-1]